MSKVSVNALQSLQDEIGAWSDRAFGNDVNGRLVPVLKHLRKEVDELISEPTSSSEFADCFMLLLDAARMAYIPTDALIRFTQEKLEVNKARSWKAPDPDGVIEHERP